jgi:hypothetical protein
MAVRGPIETRKDRKSAHAIKRRIDGVHTPFPSPVVWATGLVSLAKSSSHALCEISCRAMVKY